MNNDQVNYERIKAKADAAMERSAAIKRELQTMRPERSNQHIPDNVVQLFKVDKHG